MNKKKLPYGNCNFADLIARKFAYVDKTRYIELLENENNSYQYMLRPRRFGKSLFLSTMENYYDLNNKEKFETLFGDLYIGKHPTPERGTYAILKFSFSGLDTETKETFKASFLGRIQECVIKYLERYSGIFGDTGFLVQSIMENKLGVGALDVAYRMAASVGVKIFVMIDEYDHFANNLIAMGETYRSETQRGGIVRTFYEALKEATDSVVRRIFITGVSPMMLNDLTSGFNMATNMSLRPYYNEMFGFTRDEVEWLMDQSGVDKSLITIDMEYYYNGYMFNNDGKDKVYNSQMVLFLFDQILSLKKLPNEIVDKNLKTDYGRLQRLAESERNRVKLLEIIREGGVAGQIHDIFSLEKLNSEEYFVSLLFYMGMLTCGGTFEGDTYLKIPNYSVKTLYWEYLMEYINNEQGKEVIETSKLAATIKDMAYRGNIKPFLDFFVENFAKRLSNRDLAMFDEKYIKVMMLSALYFNRYYYPVSEQENINGYTDIYLERNPAIHDIKYEYVLEIKYIKTNTDKNKKNAFAEAMTQIEKYKKDTRFAERGNVKFAAIVFRGKGDYEIKDC